MFSLKHRFARQSLYGIGIAFTILSCAELTARIDDLFASHVPFWATPDLTNDLQITGEHGEIRGKPGGRYRFYHLNSLGLLGPETTPQPAPRVTRILVLGSSETFGSTNSPQKDFPSQLRTQLASSDSFDVLNAAMPGMTARSMRQQYVHWSSQFDAQIVVICCNPLFYLNVTQPASDATSKVQRERPPAEPRILQRLKNQIEFPQSMADYRIRKQVESLRKNQPPDWVFTGVPDKQARFFTEDFQALVEAVQQSGATPLLLTHAVSVTDLSDPAQFSVVERFLQNTPRAQPDVVLKFEQQANQAIRRNAADSGALLLDLDSQLTGRRELFSDLVHYNDQGACAVAERLAEVILKIAPVPARD